MRPSLKRELASSLRYFSLRYLKWQDTSRMQHIGFLSLSSPLQQVGVLGLHLLHQVRPGQTLNKVGGEGDDQLHEGDLRSKQVEATPKGAVDAQLTCIPSSGLLPESLGQALILRRRSKCLLSSS